MKAWFHKVHCWIDEHAHMTLWAISGATEGFDATGYAAPITDLIGHRGLSFVVLAFAALGIWRSKVTRARGRALKEQVSELKQQVEATGQVPVVPEK